MAIEKVFIYNNTSIIQDEVRWNILFISSVLNNYLYLNILNILT